MKNTLANASMGPAPRHKFLVIKKAETFQ